ncbi:Ig-like domain repeat protein [Duffyella gerundensis]|uniref:Ig-like domain-containing protein n=1 Tax=Duffyella gerundensis TaxID=1619313 RepID=UPI001CE2B9B4|nr:Ig-like domain-containing protein [Duffyella gerundensis]UCB29947.1 Ig-like domain repeat protein [Duffyella gerundensis]
MQIYNAHEIWTSSPDWSITLQPKETDLEYMFVHFNNVEFKVLIAGQREITWSPPADLFKEGVNSVSIRYDDLAKNPGHPSIFNLILDTTAPDKPRILYAADDVGSNTSIVGPDGRTDDQTPVLTGIAEKNSLVTLYNAQDEPIGSVYADNSGLWEIEAELAEGEHQLYVTAEDNFGHASNPSDAFKMIIGPDLSDTPPGVALITHAQDDIGPATGELRSGAVTDDTRPQLHGTAQGNSIINIQYRNADGEWIDGASATANASGQWNWTAPALEEGEWEFRANAGGNWGQPFTLEIATAGSDALKAVISEAEDNFGDVTGPLLSGAITDDSTPTLHGRAEANASVVIRWSNGTDTLSTTVNADASSNWQWSPEPALAPGEWTFTTQTGSNSWSAPFTLELITPGAHVPLIAEAWDNVDLIIGPVASGGETNDNELKLSGRGEANRLLNIYDNGGLLASVTVGADGKWQLTTPVLEDGDHRLSVSYGSFNTSLETLNFKVDTQDPDGPGIGNPEPDPVTIDHAQDDFNVATGQLMSGAMTDDATPTLNGTGVNSSSVVLNWSKGNETYSTTVNTNSDGSWQWTPSSALATGEWSFTARNSTGGDWSTPFSLEIITPGSHVPLIARAWDDVNLIIGPISSGGDTNDNQPTLSGRGEANRLLNIYDGGELLTSVTVGADGNWQVITPVLDEGDHSLSVSYGSFTNTLQTLDFEVDTRDPDGPGDLSRTGKVFNLSFEDIMTDGQKSLWINNDKRQYKVDGNEGDVLQLDNLTPQEWLAMGEVTIAGTQYDVWSHQNGETELLIQQGIISELDQA